MTKVGCPRKLKMNQKTYNEVASIAARGLSKKAIAQQLGISYVTLNEYCKEFSEFSDAIKRGQATAIGVVEDALYKRALDKNSSGDYLAITFWLKNRHNEAWKDRSTTEVTGKDGRDLIDGDAVRAILRGPAVLDETDNGKGASS